MRSATYIHELKVLATCHLSHMLGCHYFVFHLQINLELDICHCRVLLFSFLPFLGFVDKNKRKGKRKIKLILSCSIVFYDQLHQLVLYLADVHLGRNYYHHKSLPPKNYRMSDFGWIMNYAL